MNVCVLGLGYIGLPTAAMFALAGHQVTGCDSNPQVLASLRRRDPQMKESSVRALIIDALDLGTFNLSHVPPSDSEAYIICVPTPSIGNKPQLSYVDAAIQAIVPHLSFGDLLILESTVPPGTIDQLIVPALRKAGLDPDDFAIVHCPERVIPGAIVTELRNNPRVIGGRRPGDAERARALYASFVEGPIHLTDNITAELVKVIENTYRDVNIAFANELALVSEELGVDAHEVIFLANKHPRVDILQPGPGVGGHCIPVDPYFLSNANPFLTELIQTSRRVNERMPHFVTKRICEYLPISAGSTVTLLGAAYKANIDDTRESPTLQIEELLLERGYVTRVFDPLADKYRRPLSASLHEAVDGTDAIILMVGHAMFEAINPHAIAVLVRSKVLIDTRAFFAADVWAAAGFNVYTLGKRRRVAPTENLVGQNAV